MTKKAAQSHFRPSGGREIAVSASVPEPAADTSDRPSIRSAAVDLTALAVFWLLFFWPILIARDHLIPYDLIDQHYMYQAFLHGAFTDGASPWWTPHILGGYPIAADPLSALFYPPNVLMHVLTPDAFLPYLRVELQLALHFLWASIGTYLLARALTGSRAGALIAGLAFAYGAFFAWHTPHLSPISSLSWLPWILLCFHLAVRQRSMLWTGLGAASFGAMVLAGHALTIVQVGYLLAGLTVLLCVQQWRADRTDRRRIATTCAIGATMLVLGAGLAAIQLLPSMELSNNTNRASFGWNEASASSYRPHWLLTVVLPDYLGHEGPATYWASGDPAETNSYIGLLPLLLAALGLARSRAADRRVALLLLGGALLALVVAFGSQTWLYRVLFDVLPGVDRVRRPGNAIALVHFSVALLAAYGVRTLQRDWAGDGGALRSFARWLRIGLVAAVGSAVIAAAALPLVNVGERESRLIGMLDDLLVAIVILLVAWLLVKMTAGRQALAPLLLIGLVVILAFDLGSANAHVAYQHHASRPDSYIGADWAGSPHDPFIRDLSNAMQSEQHPRVLPAPSAGSIWDNGPLVWGIDSTYGYSVLWPTHYQELYSVASANPASPLFAMLGARYVVSTAPIETAYPASVDTSGLQLLGAGFYHLYEHPAAWSRVWVVHESVSLPESDVLSYMTANAGSLATTVVLSERAPEAESGSTTPDDSAATIVEYLNDRVVVDVAMTAPGYLVLADTWYPGWSATVDGEQTEVYRANHAFRAVWLPAGEHVVEFSFEPTHRRSGTLLSGLSAVLVGLLIVGGAWQASYPKRRRRQTSGV